MTEQPSEAKTTPTSTRIELGAGYIYSGALGAASLAFIGILVMAAIRNAEYAGIDSILGTMLWPAFFLAVAVVGIVATIRLHKASKSPSFQVANQKGLIGYGVALAMLSISTLGLLGGGILGAVVGLFLLPGGLLGLLITYSLQQRRRKLAASNQN